MNSFVSVIIVNWNGKENLKECLNSLFRITYSPFEVIVVDNASSDGSVGMLKKEFPRVMIVEAEKNLGFAQGNNLGYEKSTGEYILLLNNDCIVTNNFLDELASFLKANKNVGIVQPTIFFHRPKTIFHNKINSIGSFFLSNGFLYHQDYGKNFNKQKYDKPFEIFSAYGACFFVKREVIEKVGLFDSDFFAYFEETDLCHRAWLAGYKVMTYPSVHVFHKGAQTSARLPSAFVQFHSFKNKFYTYLKNLSYYYLLKMFLPHLLICELGSVIFLLSGKFGHAWATQRAIFWNIARFKKIISERENVQKNVRQVNDSSFIPKLTRSVNLKYYYFISRVELERYDG